MGFSSSDLYENYITGFIFGIINYAIPQCFWLIYYIRNRYVKEKNSKKNNTENAVILSDDTRNE